MRMRKNLAKPLLITLVLLTVLEIVSSTLSPFLGLSHYKIPFNILIVLFMGLRLKTPYIAFLILAVQYVHGLFSIEGWELGTFVGVFITILVGYLQEFLHFTTVWMTILLTQLFQCIWFLLVSTLIYLKTGNTTYLLEKLWRFFPESIVISLMAPFFFILFEKIWIGEGHLREQS